MAAWTKVIVMEVERSKWVTQELKSRPSDGHNTGNDKDGGIKNDNHVSRWQITEKQQKPSQPS